MTARRRQTGLLLLLTFAFALRLAAVALLHGQHAAPITYEHGAIAESLLAGKGFSVTFLGIEGPTSQQAPLYPCLLALLYWLFGAGSPAAIFAMQLLQCAAGTATVACVVWLTRSIMPGRANVVWLAGLAAAVYPPHVYAVTHIQVVTWTALCLTLLLAISALPRWSIPWRQSATAGVIAGILLLLDPIMAVALPIVAISLAIKQTPPSIHGYLKPAICMALTTLLVIAPWLVRNYHVHGELVFVKSTFGYALWQGNNPASWGTDKIPKPAAEQLRQQHNHVWRDQDRALWEARHETLYIDDVLLKPTGYGEFAGLSEPARSRLLGTRAWQFISSNPAAYGRLCLQRLRYFLLFDETNPKAAHWLYRCSTAAWLALAAIGLTVEGRNWRNWWPLPAIFAAVTVFHVLTIVSARFRIPVEPLTFCWVGAALATFAERLVLTIRRLLSRADIRRAHVESSQHPAAVGLPGSQS